MGINKSYLKELAEKKKFKSGGMSTEGYKRNSPDVNNPYNVIPSNQITMKGVDFPIMGIDDIGHQQMMYPGNDYTFPGSYVTEFPLKNMGNKRYGQVGLEKRMPWEKPTTQDWNKLIKGEYKAEKDLGKEIERQSRPEGAKPIEEVKITAERPGMYTRTMNAIKPYVAPPGGFLDQVRERMVESTGGENWYKQPNSVLGAFAGTVTSPLAAPQQGMMYGLTGKVQTPSEALNIQNPVGAFVTDVALDPMTYLGMGVSKIPQKVGQATRPVLRGASEYLTTQTPLKNILKGYKPIEIPSVGNTSYSIMRTPEGQIQFLDNDTYRNALVTGKNNVISYLSDPRYKAVVEKNQQLANKVGMNKTLPIQKEMGNVGLHEARVSKINQPITILDPRPLETKIIQGTNEGIQAQYSRNLDGSGFLTIPRVHDLPTTIKNVEHEALHHIYPNLGEGYPSFTPLETAKAKSVFKPAAELRKIEEANDVPFWYLDDVDELVPNSFDLARGMGIEKFQSYPGKEAFQKMLDSYKGSKSFIKDALKLETNRDYKRAWDMLSGVRLGLVPPAILIGAGAATQQKQQPKGTYQMGGTIGIPGVNGQVVSSGPQPLTSVKKTRGPISKNKKGDVKTMSNTQVKKILKNIK